MPVSAHAYAPGLDHLGALSQAPHSDCLDVLQDYEEDEAEAADDDDDFDGEEDGDDDDEDFEQRELLNHFDSLHAAAAILRQPSQEPARPCSARFTVKQLVV